MTAAAYRSCASGEALAFGAPVRDDHSADPRIGEYLEQDGVRQPPVEHVRLRHAAARRCQAGLHLGDHPAAQPGQHRLKLGRGQLLDHLAGPLCRRLPRRGIARPVGVEPGHIGEQDQLCGAERDRDGGGRCVGVHVVDLSCPARGDAGDDRDPAVGDQREDGARVDGGDLPDLAEVHRRAVDGGVRAGRGEQVRVLAGHPDGERPVPVDQPDDLAVHLAGQHHPDHVHGLRRGDPQPGGEGAADAELAEVLADLRAAAVHHHRAQARVAQEHHVLGERGAQRLVGHGMPAEFDHDGPAVKPFQPGQRLDQGRRLGQRPGALCRRRALCRLVACHRYVE
jgi:hypothetical protein